MVLCRVDVVTTTAPTTTATIYAPRRAAAVEPAVEATIIAVAIRARARPRALVFGLAHHIRRISAREQVLQHRTMTVGADMASSSRIAGGTQSCSAIIAASFAAMAIHRGGATIGRVTARGPIAIFALVE